jgi:hypothetical protein
VRSLPNLTDLQALQINFILDASTPPVSMTGVGISSPHHYAGTTIEPHTSASATMLNELRQAVVDGLSFCRFTTQVEWLGFSWLQGGRHQIHLDSEGNPYVFLSRIVRDYGPPSDADDDELEEDDDDVDGDGDGDDNGNNDDNSMFEMLADRIDGEAGQDSLPQHHSKPKPGSDSNKTKTNKTHPPPHQPPPFTLWAENDLNISEVQGIKIWDKEIWAGRL